jgi:hypothetical protein
VGTVSSSFWGKKKLKSIVSPIHPLYATSRSFQGYSSKPSKPLAWLPRAALYAVAKHQRGSNRLLERGDNVIVVDNLAKMLKPYWEVSVELSWSKAAALEKR